MIGVYAIINVVSGKLYVGQSHDLRKRWLTHQSKLRVQKHRCAHLQASWDKYGKSAFIFEILEECSSEELSHTEQFYMDYFRFIGAILYNSAPAAGSCKGCKHTEAAKQKLSLAKKGIKFSEEHKRALSQAWKTRPPLSVESIQKGAAKRRGQPRSEKLNRQTSETLMGHKVSGETRAKIAKSLQGNTPWNKGVTGWASEEVRCKMSVAHKGQPSASRLTPEVEREIVNLLNTTDTTHKNLATTFGVSVTTINNIVKRNVRTTPLHSKKGRRSPRRLPLITEQMIVDIYTNSPITQKELAVSLGLSKSTIQNVLKRSKQQNG